MKLNFVKRENASDLILILMISALMSLLVTRFLLYIFGWPTISFGVWHIAHVLWGGVFMLIGMILVLAVRGEKVRKIAAIVAGAGWGLFIDEIGKYLTKDNDYWFQPAIIFIYVSFVFLFLVYRYFEKNQKLKPLSSSINSGQLPLTKGSLEKTIWQQFLAKTGYYSYNKIFKRRFIKIGLAIFAGCWSVDKIWETIRIISNPQKLDLIKKFYEDYSFIGRSDIYMIILKIISDAVAAILFLGGLYWYSRRRRTQGIKYFQLGLIVSIFLSSVFKLYFEQFSEVPVLGVSILLLVAISRLRREIN